MLPSSPYVIARPSMPTSSTSSVTRLGGGQRKPNGGGASQICSWPRHRPRRPRCIFHRRGVVPPLPPRCILLLLVAAAPKLLTGRATISCFASHTSRRVVGQWGGAGGAVCEDHFGLAPRRLRVARAVNGGSVFVASVLLPLAGSLWLLAVRRARGQSYAAIRRRKQAPDFAFVHVTSLR